MQIFSQSAKIRIKLLSLHLHYYKSTILNIDKYYEGSLWSVAAKMGLALSIFTILPTLASSLLNNSITGAIFWLIKVVFSLWMLRYLMYGWDKTHNGESTLGFGLATCLCSSVLCAVFTFALYKFIVPDLVIEQFKQIEDVLASINNVPEDAIDAVLRIEDNYPQVSCAATFFWCVFTGLIFSLIFKGTISRNNVFTEDEMNQNND